MSNVSLISYKKQSSRITSNLGNHTS